MNIQEQRCPECGMSSIWHSNTEDGYVRCQECKTTWPRYQTCSSCDGSGLRLNYAGEPDECVDCKGNTVVPVNRG